jgi:hypothetical protein
MLGVAVTAILSAAISYLGAIGLLWAFIVFDVFAITYKDHSLKNAIALTLLVAAPSFFLLRLFAFPFLPLLFLDD